MTRNEIRQLRVGDVITRRQDFRALEVVSTSRLDSYNDILVYELDIDDNGDLVRMDDNEILITIAELTDYEA